MVQILAGVRGQRVEAFDQGSSVAIHLADDPSEESELRTWRFDVYADKGDGLLLLGNITSRTPPAPPAAASPPLPPQPRDRIIAICTCPGANRWVVQVRYGAERRQDIPPGARCDVNLLGAPTASLPGVQPINERSLYVAGNAAATFTLARGQRVSSWSAFSSGVNATVQINGGDIIPVPPAAAVQGEPNGALDGALFDFAGADLAGYFVEFKEC